LVDLHFEDVKVKENSISHAGYVLLWNNPKNITLLLKIIQYFGQGSKHGRGCFQAIMKHNY
jgi:hypothetical protein